MADGNMINSADKWNLNHTYDKVKDMSNSGKYVESVKLAEKGLSMACQTNDKIWVQKFDNILVDMINQHNKVKFSEQQTNEKAIYNIKAHKRVRSSEKDLTKIKGIGASVEKKLIAASIETIHQLASLKPKDLTKVKGFGLPLAKRLIEEAQTYLNKTYSENKIIPATKEKIQEKLLKKVNDDVQLNKKNEIRKNQLQSNGLVKYLVEKVPDNPNNEIEFDKNIDEDFEKIEDLSLKEGEEEKIFKAENDQITFPDTKICNTLEATKQINQKEQEFNKHYNGKTSFSDENAIYLNLEKDNEFEFEYDKELEEGTFNYNNNDEEYPPGELRDYNNSEQHLINPFVETNYSINEYESEKLEKILVKSRIKNIEKVLKSLNYRIVQKNSNLLNNISKDIDLLAFKTQQINNQVSLLLMFPIKFRNLKGNLIISNNHIDYNPYNQDLKINERINQLIIGDFDNKLSISQENVFQSIIYEGNLFNFFEKSINKRITVEKTTNNKRLFIRSGTMMFKVIVDPIFICENEPAFLEKPIKFPYQKNSNLHILKIDNLSDLIHFLEKKYFLIESHTAQKNSISYYFNALTKFRLTIRNYSIPFLLYGTLFCFVILLQYLFLINTLTNLGYAAMGIYVIILWYSYFRFSKTQKEIIEEYNTPYYQRKIHVDETDLTIIKDEISTELLDQFIYECLGKNIEFSITAKIEEEKIDNLIYNFKRNKETAPMKIGEEINTNNEQIFESNEMKDKLISKYSSFLED